MTWGNASDLRALQQRLDAERPDHELSDADATLAIHEWTTPFAMLGLYGEIPGTDTRPIPLYRVSRLASL